MFRNPDYNARQVILRVYDEVNECIRVCVISQDDIGSPLNIYGSVTSVASSTPTSIVSYLVPANKVFVLKEIEGSGCNISTFTVKKDSTDIANKRSYWCDFNVNFPFYNIEIQAGETIELIGEHLRPSTGDFEARIIGILKDA